jgi:hypothetical protein
MDHSTRKEERCFERSSPDSIPEKAYKRVMNHSVNSPSERFGSGYKLDREFAGFTWRHESGNCVSGPD